MLRAVLLTHGMLGTELLRAATKIYGAPEGIVALSNDGTSQETLLATLREQIGTGTDPVFVFVDVVGGSCCIAALALREVDPRIRLVAGVNLPMILEFLHYRTRVDAEELLQRVLSRGRDAVREP